MESLFKRLFSIKAPVGHACTHSPHATHELNPIGSSKSKIGLEDSPLFPIPITSLTCISLQALSQRPHDIHASKFTAIEGCESS